MCYSLRCQAVSDSNQKYQGTQLEKCFLNMLLDTLLQHSSPWLSGSPKGGRRISGAPWVPARCRLMWSCSLWSNQGWLDPSSCQAATWTPTHPAFQIKESQSRWEVRERDLAHFKWRQQHQICVSSCYRFTSTAGWEVELGTLQGVLPSGRFYSIKFPLGDA